MHRPNESFDQNVLDGMPRRIDFSLFCENCGYNLRSLPYIGICPECAHVYNARPTKMEGVFIAQYTEFPSFNIVATLLCIGGGAGFVYASIRAASVVSIVLAIAFIAAVPYSLYITRKEWRRFWLNRRALKQIQSEEYD